MDTSTRLLRAAFLVSVLLTQACDAEVDGVGSSIAGGGGNGGDPTGGGGKGGTGGGGKGGAGGEGQGGAGAGGGAGGASACEALAVLPIAIPPSALVQSKPQIDRLPDTGQALYFFLNEQPGAGPTLYGMTADAFNAWPPAFGPALPIDNNVNAYAIGPGPAGPVGILQYTGNLAPILAASLWPMVVETFAPLSENGTPLFVTAIPDRYLWAHGDPTPGYEVLHVGSYQPGSLPQSEEPLICTKTPHLAAAVGSGDGFLAAFIEPSLQGPACEPMNPKPGSVVSISRYSAPPGAGTFLSRSQGAQLTLWEPLVNLGLAATSFGAWLVFETDGSTSEFPPPAIATRLDSNGNLIVPEGDWIPIIPAGYDAFKVAVATLGDTLAAASPENADPGAPTIRVQLARPDGSLGPSALVPTKGFGYKGHIRLLASPAQNSLLLAWEASMPPVTAFARIDCVPTR